MEFFVSRLDMCRRHYQNDACNRGTAGNCTAQKKTQKFANLIAYIVIKSFQKSIIMATDRALARKIHVNYEKTLAICDNLPRASSLFVLFFSFADLKGKKQRYLCHFKELQNTVVVGRCLALPAVTRRSVYVKVAFQQVEYLDVLVIKN